MYSENNQKLSYRYEIFDQKKRDDCELLFDPLSQPELSIVRNIDDLKVLQEPAVEKWLNFSKHVILGTGGSSLSGQIICELGNCENSVSFVDNLDPSSIKKTFDAIDYENTGFVVISKSGETLETICQFLYLVENLCNRKISVNEHIIVITQNRDSSIMRIAVSSMCFIIEHPEKIGGRFSVFSIVGMLPAKLAGFCPYKMRASANEVLLSKLPVIGSNYLYDYYRHHFMEHVFFIYCDKLKSFGRWLCQLFAESSGKDGMGITPIVAIGAVDQHSQLQLYVDGPKNKAFTFLVADKHNQNDDVAFCKEDILSGINLNFLKNKSFGDVFLSQSAAAVKSLLIKNIPVRKFGVDINLLSNLACQEDADCISQLFMHFMIEVIQFCSLINVCAFDQPGVEWCKKTTEFLLGHKV